MNVLIMPLIIIAWLCCLLLISWIIWTLDVRKERRKDKKERTMTLIALRDDCRKDMQKARRDVQLKVTEIVSPFGQAVLDNILERQKIWSEYIEKHFDDELEKMGTRA